MNFELALGQIQSFNIQHSKFLVKTCPEHRENRTILLVRN